MKWCPHMTGLAERCKYRLNIESKYSRPRKHIVESSLEFNTSTVPLIHQFVLRLHSVFTCNGKSIENAKHYPQESTSSLHTAFRSNAVDSKKWF